MNIYTNNSAFYFADTYNCGAYGAGSFNDNAVCGQAVGAPNTGYAPLDAVGGWDFVLVAGIVVLVAATTGFFTVLRRRHHQK